jgi:hypothetical protein
MISDSERYHGAVIRNLIIGRATGITIQADDDSGQVNTYRLDGNVGIHIKHSTKRLPPWQFTYLHDHINEIEGLAKRCRQVWLIHICGQNGSAVISLEEFFSINPPDADTTRFVRVDCDRNTMYRVNGTGGRLARSTKRGLQRVIESLDN